MGSDPPYSSQQAPLFLRGLGLVNNSSCQGLGHCESKGASEAMDSGWQPFLQVEGPTGGKKHLSPWASVS